MERNISMAYHLPVQSSQPTGPGANPTNPDFVELGDGKWKHTLEHTYVVTIDNEGESHPYGCHGGSENGKLMDDTVGPAQKWRTDILDAEHKIYFGKHKMKKGKGKEAGIVYGLNGVCHQMSNRIMYESGKTVNKAKGYTLSKALFGAYGLKLSPFLRAWLSSSVAAILISGPVTPVTYAIIVNRLKKGIRVLWHKMREEADLLEQPKAAIAGYSAQLAEHHFNNYEQLETDPDAFHSKEFELYVRHKIGEDIHDDKLNEILKFHHELNDSGKIDATNDVSSNESAHSNNELLHESIARKINDSVNGFASKCHDVLDDAQYRSLFDVEPGVYVEVVEADKLKESLDDLQISAEDLENDD